MNNIYAVIDIARDCQTNIALDEVFFTEKEFKPILRFYTWTKPAYTIGYFQKYSELENKNNYDIVRRLTGGLSVLHNTDLSYSFIVSDKEWDYIYNQEETYKIIHEQMKKALLSIGINCDTKQSENLNPNNFSCVNTFYKDEGKILLVEGSIHLKMSNEQINIFAKNFFNNISSFLKGNIIETKLDEKYITEANILIKNKYNNEKWIKLF